jgi:sterol desaturase/sphingolipid hydroxylase (fatty acid hydroxylase superfamily)
MKFSDFELLIAAALILAPLERLLPMQRQRTFREGLTTDLLHFAVSGFLIRGGTAVLIGLLSVAVSAVDPFRFAVAIQAQPVWLQFCELLLLSDLGFYLAHRTVHAVPWLWRFHAVHHSSETLDWLSTFRVHPIDQIFNSTIIALPWVLLPFSPVAVVSYALCYQWQAMLLHSNIRLKLGIFDRLIATPNYHHWHHADQAEAYDKNFGGQLVIWDALFGTAHRTPASPARYGTSDEISRSYIGQIVNPFRSMFRNMSDTRPSDSKSCA